MKKVILCADDYGQNSAISQAIVTLLAKKHLSSTSCLVTAPEFKTLAPELTPFLDKADIGLHFNLTEGQPASTQLPHFYPLIKLIPLALSRLLDGKKIEAELNAQLDIFETSFGTLPNYIDGHQHVHQFPVIRDALFKVYDQRLRDFGTYIRSTYNEGSYFKFHEQAYIKKAIINLCGAQTFKKQLQERNVPHNISFSGIYKFEEVYDYRALFPSFLDEIKETGIIMCHPGLESSDADEINYARPLEFKFLNDDQFLKVLEHHKVELVRFEK